jgi:predicted anti-sigma-YlaC factor YlaD
MNLLMFSCVQATEIIEKQFYTEITLSEKVKLYLHRNMCDACREYYGQSVFLDQFLRRYKEKNVKRELSEDEKKAIISHLEKLQ